MCYKMNVLRMSILTGSDLYIVLDHNPYVKNDGCASQRALAKRFETIDETVYMNFKSCK